MSQSDKIFSSVFRPSTEPPVTKGSPGADGASTQQTHAAWNIVTTWLRLPRNGTGSIARSKFPSRLDEALSCLLAVEGWDSRLVIRSLAFFLSLRLTRSRPTGSQMKYRNIRLASWTRSCKNYGARSVYECLDLYV